MSHKLPDFMKITGIWLAYSAPKSILITAEGDDMHAWTCVFTQDAGTVPGAEYSEVLLGRKLQTRKFKHLSHDETDAMSLSMRGLMKLAHEWLAEL